MIVQPRYVVVEKVVLSTDLYLSKFYVDEYQTCKVIQTSEDSIYSKGETLLVGNKICFDKAPQFGGKTFYIDATEVFGSIKNGTIVPSNNIVYIKADKNKKSKVDAGGMDLFKDITYKPLETSNVTQDGIVLSVCNEAKHSVFENDLKIEVKPGDHVYCHHFLTDSDNEREFNGEMFYEIGYEHLYCKVANGEIKMLNEWNFVVPVEGEIGLTESGIILDLKKTNELRVGIIKHPCQKLLSRGVKSGDKVFFKRGREYRIDVEEEVMYRIETNDILSRYENMEALGEIIIVKVIPEDNMKGGFIKTVAQNPIPDKGEVLSVGEGCPEGLKAGDTILFRKMASTEVEIEGKKVLMMNYKSAYVKV
jgi:chaperonin GroES